jgi:tRNA/rRNA methyltransferase
VKPDAQFAFVLVRPKSAGNIGSAARALKNMGFDDLRLVAP